MDVMEHLDEIQEVIQRTVSSSMAARYLEVSQKTIADMHKTGVLPGIATPLGVLYPKDELQRVWLERNAKAAA